MNSVETERRDETPTSSTPINGPWEDPEILETPQLSHSFGPQPRTVPTLEDWDSLRWSTVRDFVLLQEVSPFEVTGDFSLNGNVSSKPYIFLFRISQ